MPFDPSLPADNARVVSPELRNQFNGLYDLITPKVSMQDVLDAIAAGAARSLDSVQPLNIPFHDPPTRAEVQLVADKINEILSTAHS